jgi:Ca2+/Na+ antiporter
MAEEKWYRRFYAADIMFTLLSILVVLSVLFLMKSLVWRIIFIVAAFILFFMGFPMTYQMSKSPKRRIRDLKLSSRERALFEIFVREIWDALPNSNEVLKILDGYITAHNLNIDRVETVSADLDGEAGTLRVVEVNEEDEES